MTHTPGPWETTMLSDGTECGACEFGGGDMIAILQGEHDTPDNARLIAAAPDMLAALEDVTASLDYAVTALQAPANCTMRENLTAARAAIARAKAQS